MPTGTINWRPTCGPCNYPREIAVEAYLYRWGYLPMPFGPYDTSSLATGYTPSAITISTARRRFLTARYVGSWDSGWGCVVNTNFWTGARTRTGGSMASFDLATGPAGAARIDLTAQESSLYSSGLQSLRGDLYVIDGIGYSTSISNAPTYVEVTLTWDVVPISSTSSSFVSGWDSKNVQHPTSRTIWYDPTAIVHPVHTITCSLEDENFPEGCMAIIDGQINSIDWSGLMSTVLENETILVRVYPSAFGAGVEILRGEYGVGGDDPGWMTLFTAGYTTMVGGVEGALVRQNRLLVQGPDQRAQRTLSWTGVNDGDTYVDEYSPTSTGDIHYDDGAILLDASAEPDPEWSEAYACDNVENSAATQGGGTAWINGPGRGAVSAWWVLDRQHKCDGTTEWDRP